MAADSPTPELRLFVALSIPEPIKHAAQAAQEELRRSVEPKTVRWTRPAQFHLTLKFLGDVPASRLEELGAACRQACQPFSPLRLIAGKVGFFPNPRRPRILWAGIADLDCRLAAIWDAVQSATRPFTRQPSEPEFTAHLTLGRLNRLRQEQIEALATAAKIFENTVFGEWTAGQLELMRSELLPEGACHSPVVVLPLEGKA